VNPFRIRSVDPPDPDDFQNLMGNCCPW